ncbi:NRAMP family [Dillenia turbinata]|uniref:NRAMP family n=1 Tax=Dillenia turbinata TaxID=194707 RepID=A0AAN8UXD3_9MAGN
MGSPELQQGETSAMKESPLSRGIISETTWIDMPKNSPLPVTCTESGNNDYNKVLGWRNFLSFVGPGFLISLAYLDPANLETDLLAGANHKYELLWVILIGLVFSLIIQSLAANLGVTTGKHLSELCRVEYAASVNYCLWFLAELAVIASDIPEVIGTAFALNILFHIPVWAGVLFTGLSTLLILGIQRYGVQKLEMVIESMVLIIGGCYFVEMSHVKPPASQVMKGLFIPKLKGPEATADTIALLGGLIMPHNLFLHSALVLSRKVPQSAQGINNACRFFLIESGLALFIALVINVAVVSVSGTLCFAEDISINNSNRCKVLNLNSASFLLKNVLGRASSTVYAVALMASGQSSAVAGTYTGQYIMQGFLDLKMKTWVRNLMTRIIAIAPSLIVSIIGRSSGAGRLIIISSVCNFMMLSFELPFALIPLLKFSSSSTKMGPHKNSIYIIVISWILGLCIVGINLYYLCTMVVFWLTHNGVSKLAKVLLGLVVFPLMAVYIFAVAYLTSRKDRIVTFVDTCEKDVNIKDEIKMESGLGEK